MKTESYPKIGCILINQVYIMKEITICVLLLYFYIMIQIYEQRKVLIKTIQILYSKTIQYHTFPSLENKGRNFNTREPKIL